MASLLDFLDGQPHAEGQGGEDKNLARNHADNGIVGPFWSPLPRRLPEAFGRRWPWIRSRVREARVWATEMPDRVIIVIEAPKPPSMMGRRDLLRWVNFLRFEFNGGKAAPDEIVKAGGRIWKLGKDDEERLRRAAAEYVEMMLG